MFIELTRASDGNLIVVMIKSISYFMPLPEDEESYIEVTSGESFIVKETIDQIKLKILSRS